MERIETATKPMTSADKIRLGIEAPKEVAVWREELVTASATKRELAVA